MRPHRAIIPILSLMLVAFVAQVAPASAQFGWFGGQRDDRYPQQQQRQTYQSNSWGNNSWGNNSWGSNSSSGNSWDNQRRDAWFGRQERLPSQASAYSDPNSQPPPGRTLTPSTNLGSGRAVAYCVRLCDGRYFPMQRHANATSIQLCNQFCPAAKTQVFNGSQIDQATASNGQRYSDIANAFVYRDKIVADCTCNGKNPFGLATLDPANDPTLKKGDIVSTGDNVKAALVANAARMAKLEEVERAKTKLPVVKPAVDAVPDAPADVSDDDKPED